MPLYRDKVCYGLCEQFALKCLKPELYVEVAERYNAEVKEPSGTFIVNGRPVQWSHAVLNIQGEDRERAALAIAERLPVIMPGFDKETAERVAHSLTDAAPCYTDCDIVICGYCKRQHERNLIRDGSCAVLRAIEGLGTHETK